MKVRVRQLAAGTIEYRKPEIVLNPAELSMTLQPGKKLSIDVTVSSANLVPLHLFPTADEPRIRISRPLTVARSVKLSVDVNTGGLREEDVLAGEIVILYNGGEAVLPYRFRIGADRTEAETRITSVEELYRLYREDPKEAVYRFGRKDFPQLSFMQTLKEQGAYKSFFTTLRAEDALRNFLIYEGYPLPEETEENTFFRNAELPEKRDSIRSREKKKQLKLLRAYLDLEMSRDFPAVREKNEEEIRALTEAYPQDVMTRLLYAYHHIAEGNLSIARGTLISLQDQVQKERLEKKDVYCLFLNLVGTVQNDQERKTVSEKLIAKYFADGVTSPLMHLLLYRTSAEFDAYPMRAAAFLRQTFDKGITSPVFLLEMCALWKKEELTTDLITEFELRSLLFGIRNGILTEERLFEVLSGELKNQKLVPLYMLVLRTAYKRFGSFELVQAIVNVFLQQKAYGRRYYYWYSEAVKRGVRMDGLYEYYLASTPLEMREPLPRAVMQYFGEYEEGRQIRPVLLYGNAAGAYRDDPEIFSLYEAGLAPFVMKKIQLSEYERSLIPAYRMVLSEEALTADNAAGMASLFHLYEVRTEKAGAQRLIIHYPQLSRESASPVVSGVALTPVFSENAILLFEDASGRRFADPDLMKTAVFFDDAGLEEKCLRLIPEDQLLIRLPETDRILSGNGALSEEDFIAVSELIRNRRVEPFFRARLYEAAIDLLSGGAMQRVDLSEFLMEADYARLSMAYRLKLTELLVTHGHYPSAFQRVLEYGDPGLSLPSLELLTEQMMKQAVLQGDRTLIAACLKLFRNTEASAPVLNFLSAYYQGPTKEMVRLLKAVRKRHLPVRDLTERVFTQCFYTDKLRDTDYLFEALLQEHRPDDDLIRACLVLKSHQYFIEKRHLSERVKEELKKNVLRLPKVAAYALLSYFSEHVGTLSEDERALTTELLTRCVEDSTVLGCFAAFQGNVEIPEELEGRAYVEYRDPEAERVSIVGTVLPVRKYLHRTLKEVYPGVFTRSVILYRQEWLKYYCTVRKKDGSTVEVEGEIVLRANKPERRDSRYEAVQQLETYVNNRDPKEVAELVYAQLLRDAMITEIFQDKE